MQLVPCPCCGQPTEPETLCEPCCDREAVAWLEALRSQKFAQALTEDFVLSVASALPLQRIEVV